ncbi:MAG: TetR/AcrR family transcriptional regulator [Prolixibacteraceae bacterium]|nr:TetR/AcrR family transcriptional regulator [Prolixibacteraceae bacterium]
MDKFVNNQKYISIWETARELFWRHGFRRVTIKEICEKAGVSKMTFYKYFPDKIELAKTVFINIVNEGIDKFSILMKEDIPASEKIKKIVLLKAESTNNISKEFMEDFYLGSEPELQTFVEEKTTEVWGSLLEDWKKAQAAGVFRKDLKPELLLHISLKLVDLLKDEKLNKLYDTPQEFIVEFAKLVAYGISEPEK